jgi:hypothetical protein
MLHSLTGHPRAPILLRTLPYLRERSAYQTRCFLNNSIPESRSHTTMCYYSQILYSLGTLYLLSKPTLTRSMHTGIFQKRWWSAGWMSSEPETVLTILPHCILLVLAYFRLPVRACMCSLAFTKLQGRPVNAVMLASAPLLLHHHR